MRDDQQWMRAALEQAEQAFARGEVPVGAVVVYQGKMIGSGFNRTEETGLPFDHAEVVAMRAALAERGTANLSECTVYSTVEPCAMCIGAALLAKVRRVVFGAHEPKTGACESVFSIPNEPSLDHQLVVTGGVLADDARALMQSFFRDRR